MKIEPPFGANCTGAEVCFRVTECDDPAAITWTFPHLPAGAITPTVVHRGDGLFTIVALDAGAYEIEGTCCD